MAYIPYNPDLLEQGKAIISMALGLLTGQKNVDIVALTENDSDDPDFEQMFPLNMPLGDDADDDDRALYAIAQSLEAHADQVADQFNFELVETSESQSIVDYLRELMACCSERYESGQPLTKVASDLSKIDIDDGGAERCYKLNKKRFKGTKRILVDVFGVDPDHVEDEPKKPEENEWDDELDPEDFFGADNADPDDDEEDVDDDDDGVHTASSQSQPPIKPEAKINMSAGGIEMVITIEIKINT